MERGRFQPWNDQHGVANELFVWEMVLPQRKIESLSSPHSTEKQNSMRHSLIPETFFFLKWHEICLGRDETPIVFIAKRTSSSCKSKRRETGWPSLRQSAPQDTGQSPGFAYILEGWWHPRCQGKIQTYRKHRHSTTKQVCSVNRNRELRNLGANPQPPCTNKSWVLLHHMDDGFNIVLTLSDCRLLEYLCVIFSLVLQISKYSLFKSKPLDVTSAL